LAGAQRLKRREIVALAEDLSNSTFEQELERRSKKHRLLEEENAPQLD
jgi:hypothetical protein